MNIVVTEGAVTTVTEGFLEELRHWKVTNVQVPNGVSYAVHRFNDPVDASGKHVVNGGDTYRYTSKTEAMMKVQHEAIKAGLEALFGSPELPDLLPVAPDVAGESTPLATPA